MFLTRILSVFRRRKRPIDDVDPDAASITDAEPKPITERDRSSFEGPKLGVSSDEDSSSSESEMEESSGDEVEIVAIKNPSADAVTPFPPANYVFLPITTDTTTATTTPETPCPALSTDLPTTHRKIAQPRTRRIAAAAAAVANEAQRLTLESGREAFVIRSSERRSDASTSHNKEEPEVIEEGVMVPADVVKEARRSKRRAEVVKPVMVEVQHPQRGSTKKRAAKRRKVVA
ncbi:hypothetical protein HK104_000437 [Borealophlyctis nickersoniae]|nr:hypothetical protein HK104_000437 [Borealophlyctis nickersoniae]